MLSIQRTSSLTRHIKDHRWTNSSRMRSENSCHETEEGCSYYGDFETRTASFRSSHISRSGSSDFAKVNNHRMKRRKAYCSLDYLSWYACITTLLISLLILLPERPLQLCPPAIQIHPRRPQHPLPRHRLQPRRPPRPDYHLHHVLLPHPRRLPKEHRRRARTRKGREGQRAHCQLSKRTTRI